MKTVRFFLEGLPQLVRQLTLSEEFWSYVPVVSSWVVLGEVVCQVSSSWAPGHAQHLLRFLASHPKEAHVPRVVSVALHVIVTYTMHSGGVRLDGCLALRMAHLNSGITGWDGFSHIEKYSPLLSLCCTRHNRLK